MRSTGADGSREHYPMVTECYEDAELGLTFRDSEMAKLPDKSELKEGQNPKIEDMCRKI